MARIILLVRSVHTRRIHKFVELSKTVCRVRNILVRFARNRWPFILPLFPYNLIWSDTVKNGAVSFQPTLVGLSEPETEKKNRGKRRAHLPVSSAYTSRTNVYTVTHTLPFLSICTIRFYSFTQICDNCFGNAKFTEQTQIVPASSD